MNARRRIIGRCMFCHRWIFFPSLRCCDVCARRMYFAVVAYFKESES